MFDDLLFPTDGSDGAESALEHVLDLAAAHGANVHVLNVVDTAYDRFLHMNGEFLELLEEEGERVVDEAATRAKDRDVTVQTAVAKGEPYEEIVDYANSHAVDLVVMPTHGRTGLGRFLLGSVTERVVRRADVPVLTLRPDEEDRVDYPYRTVLAPADGSSCGEYALGRGIDLAVAEEAELHVLSVVETAALGTDIRSEMQIDSLEGRAERVVDGAAEAAADAGIEATTAVQFAASVPETIRTYVDDHDIDIVVVGTHGRTGFDRYVLGSVTEQLVRTCPVPVLSMREPAPE
ncbi:universal stress protein [Halorubrum sp. SD683]|uniref:universal stress protein n=1 Tax=Halorubrum sp. SD683 TaxID=1855873 RepID=UPI000A2DF976|nr:universal stress protein [Halorubrum sp. SD683]OTF01785.1 universal stress protein UspA [Halorubrum sp. SD683]